MNKKTLNLIFAGVFTLVIVFPFILNILILQDSSHKIVGNEEDWLQFWGTYSAAVGTFIVIWITLNQQKRSDERQNKLLEREYKFRVFDKLQEYVLYIYNTITPEHILEFIDRWEDDDILTKMLDYKKEIKMCRIKINSINYISSNESKEYDRELKKYLDDMHILQTRLYELRKLYKKDNLSMLILNINEELSIIKRSDPFEYQNIKDWFVEVDEKYIKNYYDNLNGLLMNEYAKYNLVYQREVIYLSIISMFHDEQQKLSGLNNLKNIKP